MILKIFNPPGVLGACSFANSFAYCGAGMKGSCADGVASTIRNGEADPEVPERETSISALAP